MATVLTITSQCYCSIIKAWDSLLDTVASWVAKRFLLAVKWEAQNVLNGELANKNDLIDLRLKMLVIQGSDLDILHQGWRVLFVTGNALAPVCAGWQYEYLTCVSWMPLRP
jgi:hypothetical protein